MTDVRFDLILTGNVAPDVSRNVAINKLAALFKCPVEQVDKLLSGKPSRIRKDLNHTELKRYQQVFSSIGVITKVYPSAASTELQAVKTPIQTDASALSLCPDGTPVLSENERYHPPLASPETEHLSIGAAGVMLTHDEAIPISAPDTEYIILAPPGTPIMLPSASDNTTPQQPSHLTLSETGTPLLEPKPAANYRLPNTKHFTLQ